MTRVRLHAVFACLIIVLSSPYPWLVVSQSTVRSLPGFPGPLPFHLETGYIGVGELDENQLFYYFVESEKNPKEDPLVVWLTGGPGCSAWSGLVFEIGPLYFPRVRYDGSLPTLKLRQHSWTKVSSIIFVDSPVWTGFSYSSGSKDNIIGDVKASKELYQFLRKWLIGHPQFLSNPLYIGGDSYSGIILPIFVQEIANGIEAGQEPTLNLKSAKKSCEGDYINPRSPKCAKDLEAVDECTSRLHKGHFLEPECPRASPRPNNMVSHRRSLPEKSEELLLPDPKPQFGCREYAYLLSDYWANDDSVRKALHIRKGTTREWKRCNYDIPYEKSVKSTIKYHLNLTTRGYLALIYSGDHDLLVPFLGTQAWIRSLNFSIVDEWRPWFVDGQVAGERATQVQSTNPRKALQCSNGGFLVSLYDHLRFRSFNPHAFPAWLAKCSIVLVKRVAPSVASSNS
ncbi:serine carboxypeptidase-like 17 isoform X2 [Magnolia sinica]|uniref:serine carboxypeptidase-like 17 isoform X2 n=1 Tax=Magnolia sinica TaxID=86752 RepID=UPI00265AEA2A|nr:serine carboxypeptidase-like 17 isoform X2 [Magnolia sinica]